MRRFTSLRLRLILFPIMVVVIGLSMVFVLTLVGLAVLWPRDEPTTARTTAQYAAPGVTFPRAEVTAVAAPGPPTTDPSGPTSTPSDAPT